jgi:hypothetical protein
MHPTLDELMPTYEIHRKHTIIITERPERVYDMLWQVRGSDMPLANVLGKVRGFGAPEDARADDLPILRFFTQPGAWTVLVDERPHTLALGLIWKPGKPVNAEGIHTAADREAFARFDEPGWVKVTWSFQLEPTVSGTRLISESRVQGTDPAGSRRFRRVWGWGLIGLGEPLMIHSFLAAVKHRADALSPEPHLYD